MRRVFILRSDTIQAYFVAEITRLRREGIIPQCVVSEYQETRSSQQNSMLHSLLGEIAKQKEWAGQHWDTESWKRLLTAAWCRTRNTGVQMVPAVDGQGFDVLYQRTSELTVGECADLITYVLAWTDDQGITIPETVA